MAVFLDHDGVIKALAPLLDDLRNSPRNVKECRECEHFGKIKEK